MKIKIQLAKKEYIQDCLNCIKNSELWDTYYKSNPLAEDNIRQSIAEKQIYVALNSKNKCTGFMGIINNGCFGVFSYLSIIAVLKRYRNNGIGKQLISKFEEMGFKNANRVFVLVGDYNKRAQKFYKNLGYKKVGKIPNIFKNGVSELILIKYKI